MGYDETVQRLKKKSSYLGDVMDDAPPAAAKPKASAEAPRLGSGGKGTAKKKTFTKSAGDQFLDSNVSDEAKKKYSWANSEDKQKILKEHGY